MYQNASFSTNILPFNPGVQTRILEAENDMSFNVYLETPQEWSCPSQPSSHLLPARRLLITMD